MKRITWVLVCVASAFLGSGTSIGQVLAKPSGTVKATIAGLKSSNKPPRPPASATVAAVDEGYIDWSYLRMNHPVVVEAMVDRVRKGEAEVATLNGLATSDKLKEYAGGGSKSKPAAPNSPPASGDRIGVKSKVGALSTLKGSTISRAGLKESAVAKGPGYAALMKLLIPLDISSSKLDFGSVVDGQAVRKTIYIRNAPAGVAKAELSSKSPFRILQVNVLEGRYAMLKAGAWKESLIGTFGAESAGISGELGGPGATALARPRMDPSVIGRINGGGTAGRGALSTLRTENNPTIAALSKRTEAKAAPFEVDAPEGATVRVVLEFKPKFNLFGGDYVGRHDAELALFGGEQTAKVKLTAFFEGVNLGVITIPQDREYTAFVSGKMEKHPSGGNMVVAQQKIHFGYALTFLNPKADTPIGISAVDLPAGVRLSEASPAVAKNGRTDGYVDFEMNFWGDDRGAQYGLGQEILIRVSYGTSSRYVSLTLNVLPAMRKYSARGSLDNVYYQIDMTCFEDGSIDCEFDFHTTNAWPTDGEFKFSIDGVEMVHYDTIWMNDGNRMKTKGTPRFKVDRLAEEWERFVQKGSSFWIKVTEKFRL